MPTTDELKSSKQSNDLVARLRHLEKYEWNSCSEDYGAQMTIAMGREVLAEIERLTRAKADWEECVALRDAEIERLTREREVLRGKLVATEGELAAIGRERDTLELWVRDHHGIEERLRAALERLPKCKNVYSEFWSGTPCGECDICVAREALKEPI